MVASSLKLMAPPANLPLGMRSLIATRVTSCSAISSENAAWNCFRSSRVWFLTSDSLRTLHSGKLISPRSSFSKHSTASLAVSSTPQTIIMLLSLFATPSATALFELQATTATARVVTRRRFRGDDRRNLVQKYRQLGDGFNRTLAAVYGNVGVQPGLGHLGFDNLLACLTSDHQR